VVEGHGRLTISQAMSTGSKYHLARAKAEHARDMHSKIDATYAAEMTDLYRTPSPSYWGAALAIGAGAVCSVVSGGALAVACFAAAGAAGGLIDYSNNTGSMNFSTKGALVSAGVGGALGAIAPGAGQVVGKMASSLASRFPVLGTRIGGTVANTGATTSSARTAATNSTEILQDPAALR